MEQPILDMRSSEAGGFEGEQGHGDSSGDGAGEADGQREEVISENPDL